jgi:MFS family permease
MKPFSRETVVDRRNPAVRWGAVVAGTATAIAVWMLLQMFGSGVALAAYDVRDLDRMRGIGIGSTAWSVLAPLIALFLGGMLAARIAGHHERRVAGVHGLLVWAFTTILGVVTVSSSIAMMTPVLAVHSAVSASDMNQRALMSASDAGTAFLVASLALALGLIAAVGGALTGGHAAVRRRRLDTEPGISTTAPYPPVDPIDPRIRED